MAERGQRRVCAALVIALLTVPTLGVASHGGPDEPNPTAWADGDGEVLLDVDNVYAIGDTVSFEATRTPSGSKPIVLGSVEYLASGLGAGSAQGWHASVDCLVVADDTAVLGGAIDQSQGAGASGRFALRVSDQGTRDDSEPSDVIELVHGEGVAGDCGDGDFGNLVRLSLARGDATVHDPS